MKNTQSELMYLACPYSHPDLAVKQMRHEMVNRIALKFHQQGKFVYSPLTHNVPLMQQDLTTSNWNFWGSFDKLMLSKCDKLLVVPLPGWEESRGVSAEIALAKELNLPIEIINLEELVIQNG